MERTIKRGHAIVMYESLMTLGMGSLVAEELGKVMDNVMALQPHYEMYQKLMQELGKRLYEGKEQEELTAFNEKMKNMQRQEDVVKKAEALEAIKAEYPELYPLFIKQLTVDSNLRDKDIKVELTEVDKKAFVAAILASRPKASIAEVEVFFAPLFAEEEKEEVETDFSELDELMAE